jgi:hypothetical protein
MSSNDSDSERVSTKRRSLSVSSSKSLECSRANGPRRNHVASSNPRAIQKIQKGSTVASIGRLESSDVPRAQLVRS